MANDSEVAIQPPLFKLRAEFPLGGRRVSPDQQRLVLSRPRRFPLGQELSSEDLQIVVESLRGFTIADDDPDLLSFRRGLARSRPRGIIPEEEEQRFR